ncbi:ABC transporter transmembrane domain-containing protein [Promicromonospora sp. MS192]|uniref:ABC transporter transmembrane domain-containing protein n=1 Tax=Promicromonospora sp. MS192 TaxID=3412684 RepID=UPI003C30815C
MRRRRGDVGRIGLLGRAVRPHLPLFVADVLTGMAFFLCAVIPGLALRDFLNDLPDDATAWALPLAPLLAYLGFKTAEAVGAAAWMAVDTVFRYRVYHDVRVRLTERLLRRPGALPPPVPTGDVLSRYREDTVEVAEMLGKRGVQLVTSSVVTSAVTVGFLFGISLRTTLLAVLPTFGIAVIAFVASRRIKELQQHARQTAGDVSAFLRDCFAGIETIKVNDAGEHVVGRVRQINDRRRHAAVRSGVFGGILASSQSIVIVLGTALVMWVSAAEIRDGRFQVGDFAYFVYALGTFGTLVDAVGKLVSRFQRFSVTGERLREVLPTGRLRDLGEPTPELPAPVAVRDDHAAGQAGVRAPGAARDEPEPRAADDHPLLEVQGLRYDHPGGRRGVHDLDLTAGAGELVVVTGPVGSGKTTLLRVLQGTLPRDDGSVAVRGLTLPPGVAMAPPLMSLTPQAPHVFSDTLATNVLLGRPRPALADVLAASTLDRDLRRVPDGADAQIGPQGHRLSGGQLHRLAAARMLAHPADVLLIDDLSASLDVETERLLLDNLLSRSRGSVLVVVSNRASVLDRADQVHRLVPGP